MKNPINLINLALVLAGLGIILSILSEVEMPERPATFAADTLAATPTPTHNTSTTPSPQPLVLPTATRVVTTSATITPTNAISAQPTAANVATATRAPESLPNTLNIVLLGSDRRPGHTDFRTDTMIIVMVDPQNKQAGVINIPRDLWVTIPGRGQNRINTLDEFGGPPMVKKGLGELLGIPIDYYVRVDFDGFKRGVDVLGGITVDVDCALEEGYPDPSAPGGIRRLKVQPGRVKMNGQMALDYSRSRLSTSIFDRMRRQSRVLLGVREKVLSAEVFPRIPELWGVMSQWVQTDVPVRNLIPLAKLASEIQIKDVHGLSIDQNMARATTSPQGAWVMIPDLAKIRGAVRNLFAAQPLTELVAKTKPCK